VPSPQSLVAFLVTLLALLIATRTQFGLSPNVSAVLSLVGALAFAWLIDRLVPPEEDEDDEDSEEADLVVAGEGTARHADVPEPESADGR